VANADIAPIDLEAALNDQDLVASYIATKARSYRSGMQSRSTKLRP
jgi:hypothetical protein